MFYSAVGDTGGAGVVGLDRGGRLWVAHVFECGAEHGGFFSIEKESAKFRLGGGGENDGHDGGMDMNGAVEWRRSVGGQWRGGWLAQCVTEKEDAAGARAGVAFGEVGCVAVDVEDHGAGVVAKNGVGMCSAII